MDADDVSKVMVNPVYAISIDPGLATPHETLVTEAQWIEANLRLIEEIGAEEWLQQLLAVLQGDFVAGPDA